MKLYRAIKSSYLENELKPGEDLSSLVGKSVSNNGQTSTSPLYDSLQQGNFQPMQEGQNQPPMQDLGGMGL